MLKFQASFTHLANKSLEDVALALAHFESLDEYVPVYLRPFTLLQEVVVKASVAAESALEDIDTLTLTGSFDYQACDAEFCFNPVSVPLTFTLDLEAHDNQ